MIFAYFTLRLSHIFIYIYIFTFHIVTNITRLIMTTVMTLFIKIKNFIIRGLEF